ncbi:rhodanese-like domain-containing protein [Streptomyces sp. H10-C2]|uniref:rhodanese-like domain-containing protein n=1 Tax=unclassified Streptomyces TaxID=2593676 RepID=UPI0024B8DEEE|nr:MULTISPECIES: rhodanese-like domain-containing protein [unclassified Streptomyces]MDJ0344909.1 rhodanese-like domain-containing protein [Streptomyces sp. PH10-H1]MDJ0373833.1 rhodanese-like domain-containing protein [Streptomyces sp. H10-C2]
MFLFRRSQARLSPGQAHERTSGGQAVLLDVREGPEWRAGHAPTAHHLPLSRMLAGAALPPEAAGKPVVAICRSGHRSQQAAKLLAERGIDAQDVKGGMTAWAHEGLPVIDERGKGGSIA